MKSVSAPVKIATLSWQAPRETHCLLGAMDPSVSVADLGPVLQDFLSREAGASLALTLMVWTESHGFIEIQVPVDPSTNF